MISTLTSINCDVIWQAFYFMYLVCPDVARSQAKIRRVIDLVSSDYSDLVRNAFQWRHNDHDGVSNHQRFDCWLNRLFGRRSRKTPKLRVTGLYEGNPPVTGGFPSQRAGNAENVSIYWRLSVCDIFYWFRSIEAWWHIYSSLPRWQRPSDWYRLYIDPTR